MLPNLPPRTRGLWLAAALAALLYGLSLGHAPYSGQPAAKAALGALLFLAALQHPLARERAWLGIAFAGSMLGDVLLSLSEWPPSFIAGLGAFLLAHLAYCALFAPWRAAPSGLRAAALVALWIAAPALYAAFFPHLAALAASVAVYIAVLVAMASLALCARTPGPQVAIGALVFVASDALIGINRFLGAFSGVDYLIWGFYAVAQLTIAFGVLRRKSN
ncbi:hypothetical protein WS70_22100 [Burkholderia mayonis]|uniref:Lysoplasmalogenase n=1 Tax=Burkholderia mayonis TaxID=1385591 RepID=A0A1B4FLH0_9BURK|nr:lysoplasmalogenase [Burkholderia mayonis]AOJ04511.1 hypothetical protein WS70_22100 [Burkholderia mayonis]KVE40950.1 hypothetical protein WS70_15750 [Burkholderia mayonis]